MNWLTRAVKYMFWLLVVSWGAKVLRWVVVGMLRYAAGATVKQQGPAQANAPRPATGAVPPETQLASRRLVRDPVCGMHIAEVLAIPLRQGSEILYFCSTACRDAYEGNSENARTMAAGA